MDGARTLTREMRVILWISTFFVFVAGVQLYLLSGETDDWFAWTIQPPLTAAFLGAFYFASVAITLGGLREQVWDRAGVAIPGVIVFVWAMLGATVLHLDKFHHDDGDLVPAFAAWVWLAVYFLEPPVLLWLYRRQVAAPGGESPCTPDVPGWFGWVWKGWGALLIVIGLVLFIAPDTADELWPWTLSPLTARAVSATLLGVGAVAIAVGRQRCLVRMRWPLVAILTMGTLVAVALLRYPDTFDAGGTAGVCFIVVLAVMLAASLYGLIAERRV